VPCSGACVQPTVVVGACLFSILLPKGLQAHDFVLERADSRHDGSRPAALHQPAAAIRLDRSIRRLVPYVRLWRGYRAESYCTTAGAPSRA
jgi:hypothetical protein